MEEPRESYFTKEVKKLLSGVITDPDIIRYLGYKITELHLESKEEE